MALLTVIMLATKVRLLLEVVLVCLVTQMRVVTQTAIMTTVRLARPKTAAAVVTAPVKRIPHITSIRLVPT